MRDDGGRRLISVGLTYRPDLFPDSVTSVSEFLDRVTREHPILRDFVRSGTVVDTNLYRNYLYGARQRYSSQGWFLIGDAADTVDPLYSSGLALAAMAIQQVGAMVRRDVEGRLTMRSWATLTTRTPVSTGWPAGQVARLYDVMQDGYQCYLRMHLHVTTIFHMAMPLFFNGYHADAVGGRNDGPSRPAEWRAGPAVGRLRTAHRQGGATDRSIDSHVHQGAVDLRHELRLVRASS